jgi:lipopolysaccharide export system protein LptA
MKPRNISVTIGLSLCLIGYSAASQNEESRATFADGSVSGFQGYKVTSTAEGRHFLMVHAPGTLIHLVSTKNRFKATCARAEGNITNQRILVDATLSGGVHASVERPSGERGSSATQTATADGAKAIYSAANNTLDLEDSVVIHDDDPGTNRKMTATGSSAQVNLTPQGSSGDPFRSLLLEGPVRINITGTRLDNETKKRVPFVINTTSSHASFDNVRRIIVLEGKVHVKSDDPTFLGEESGIAKETITLNPDGSVNTVEANGPGASTLNPEKPKR